MGKGKAVGPHVRCRGGSPLKCQGQNWERKDAGKPLPAWKQSRGLRVNGGHASIHLKVAQGDNLGRRKATRGRRQTGSGKPSLGELSTLFPTLNVATSWLRFSRRCMQGHARERHGFVSGGEAMVPDDGRPGVRAFARPAGVSGFPDSPLRQTDTEKEKERGERRREALL